jgi:hypothetical protein
MTLLTSDRLNLPLPQAYAHGDCDQARPLLDSLDCRFCNVEADVWLCDGEILVAHDLENVRPGVTLSSLYLEPLAQRARANGGFIHARGVEFVLLIDIKNEPEALYQTLKLQLEQYEDVLTTLRRGKGVNQRAITILLSGDRPIETVATEESRRVFLDGRLPDLDRPVDPDLMPWISDSWENHFLWVGEGRLSDEEKAKLDGLVNRAHFLRQKLRFWSAPDNPAGWQTLLDAGVDLLSTDRLIPLRDFLDRNDFGPSTEL